MKNICLLAILSLSCHAAEEHSVVRFSNGDQLTGRVKGLSVEQLSWDSEILKEPAEFDLKHVVDLAMPAGPVVRKDGVDAGHEAVLEMTNGDSIHGQLSGLSETEVRLDTWYAGEMVFRRVNVKAVNISRLADYFYRGPNSLEEWTMDKEPGSWAFSGGALVSNSAGGVAREVGLPDECSISFDAEWRNAFRPRIIFFSDDITKSNPTNGYEMVFQGNSVLVKRSGTNNWFGNSTNTGVLRENEKARIEIRASLKSGKILLYVDGEFIDMWEDDAVDAAGLGKGFHIICQDSSPLRIANISVAGWDGFTEDIPDRADRFQGRGFRGGMDFEDGGGDAPEKEKVPEGRMVLLNGDTIEGEVTGIKDGQITLKTQFAEVSFPIARLKNLILKSADMETPKRNKGDVRATLADGSRLVFRLDGVEDGFLTGFSQNFGNARFTRDAFKRIEFNIYNRTFDDQRGEDDWVP